MSPETLLREFDALAEAPDGVRKLRELVLQLAVRGKLVPQDPGDEPASVLVERIAAERERLSRAGITGRPKPPSPIGEEDAPFALPTSWKWTRIGDASVVVGGIQKSPKRTPVKHHYPYLRVANVQRGKLDLREIERFELTTDEFKKWRLEPGDLLIVEGNGSETEIGRCARWGGQIHDCVHQNHLIRVRPVLADIGLFFDRYLNSPDGINEMKRLAVTTSGLFNLSVGKITKIVVPLPPLAEQRRIVAKVDELMARCDELEARQQRRAEARVRLNRSLLHHLTTADDDAELAAHWQRLRESFPLLYDTPETVAELRQAVLQLAVRGKLVAQDPDDESASVLVGRIAAQREQLYLEGKVGKSKPLPPIGESEPPFTLPEGWTWARLGDVIVEGPTNGFSPKPVDRPTGTKSLTLSATTAGVFDDRHFKYVDVTIPPDSKHWLRPADLLFQRGNTIDYVGIAAVYHGRPMDFIYPDLMIRVRCAADVDVRFVHLAANSSVGRMHFRNRASGTSGSMPKINQQDVLTLPVPLPPLAEQRRIVAKVDELMALCDRLEARLTGAREKSMHLAASVVHHLTAA